MTNKSFYEKYLCTTCCPILLEIFLYHKSYRNFSKLSYDHEVILAPIFSEHLTHFDKIKTSYTVILCWLRLSCNLFLFCLKLSWWVILCCLNLIWRVCLMLPGYIIRKQYDNTNDTTNNSNDDLCLSLSLCSLKLTEMLKSQTSSRLI